MISEKHPCFWTRYLPVCRAMNHQLSHTYWQNTNILTQQIKSLAALMCFPLGPIEIGWRCLKSGSCAHCLSGEKRYKEATWRRQVTSKYSCARISTMQCSLLRGNPRDGNVVPSEIWSNDINPTTHPSHLKVNQIDVSREWELLFEWTVPFISARRIGRTTYFCITSVWNKPSPDWSIQNMSPKIVNILPIIKVQTGNQLDGSAPGLQMKWTDWHTLVAVGWFR